MRVFKSVLFFLLFFQSINAWSLENDEQSTFISQATRNSVKLENPPDICLLKIEQSMSFILSNWKRIVTLTAIPPCSEEELDFDKNESILNELNRQRKLWEELLTQSKLSEENFIKYIEAVKYILN